MFIKSIFENKPSNHHSILERLSSFANDHKAKISAVTATALFTLGYMYCYNLNRQIPSQVIPNVLNKTASISKPYHLASTAAIIIFGTYILNLLKDKNAEILQLTDQNRNNRAPQREVGQPQERIRQLQERIRQLQGQIRNYNGIHPRLRNNQQVEQRLRSVADSSAVIMGQNESLHLTLQAQQQQHEQELASMIEQHQNGINRINEEHEKNLRSIIEKYETELAQRQPSSSSEQVPSSSSSEPFSRQPSSSSEPVPSSSSEPIPKSTHSTLKESEIKLLNAKNKDEANQLINEIDKINFEPKHSHKNYTGLTILHIAVLYNNYYALQALIKAKKEQSVNIWDQGRHNTPLLLALSMLHEQTRNIRSRQELSKNLKNLEKIIKLLIRSTNDTSEFNLQDNKRHNARYYIEKLNKIAPGIQGQFRSKINP